MSLEAPYPLIQGELTLASSGPTPQQSALEGIHGASLIRERLWALLVGEILPNLGKDTRHRSRYSYRKLLKARNYGLCDMFLNKEFLLARMLASCQA